MDPEKVNEIIRHGVRHVEFCMHLCRIQHEQGLYFLFEHPAEASSWNNRLVRSLLELPEVHRVVGNMCMFDMVQQDSQEIVRIKTATGFIRCFNISDMVEPALYAVVGTRATQEHGNKHHRPRQ